MTFLGLPIDLPFQYLEGECKKRVLLLCCHCKYGGDNTRFYDGETDWIKTFLEALMEGGKEDVTSA